MQPIKMVVTELVDQVQEQAEVKFYTELDQSTGVARKRNVVEIIGTHAQVLAELRDLEQGHPDPQVSLFATMKLRELMLDT